MVNEMQEMPNRVRFTNFYIFVRLSQVLELYIDKKSLKQHENDYFPKLLQIFTSF